MPGTFNCAADPIKPGIVDVMKSNWESFSAANEHLPSHKLEREWASSFTAFTAGLDAGVGPRPRKLVNPPGQWMSEEDHHRGNTALAAEVSRSAPQEARSNADSSTHKSTTSSQSPRRQAQYNKDSTTKKANSMTVGREEFQSARQRVQGNTSSGVDNQDMTTGQGGASHNPHHQMYHITSSWTYESNHTTVDVAEEKDASSRGPLLETHCDSNAHPRCSSFRSRRARPWDL